MNVKTPHAKRSLRRAATLAAFLIMGALGGGSPALALPSPIELHRDIRDHLLGRVREAVRIPREIHREHARGLRRFLSGRAYYRPHRHYHAIYRFPVRVHDRIVHRSYEYCNGHLVGRARWHH